MMNNYKLKMKMMINKNKMNNLMIMIINNKIKMMKKKMKK